MWGKELFFDSTKVEANAAVDSLAPRWAVEANLEELFEEEEIHPPQQQDEEISEKSCEIAQLPTARDEDGLRGCATLQRTIGSPGPGGRTACLRAVTGRAPPTRGLQRPISMPPR